MSIRCLCSIHFFCINPVNDFIARLVTCYQLLQRGNDYFHFVVVEQNLQGIQFGFKFIPRNERVLCFLNIRV